MSRVPAVVNYIHTIIYNYTELKPTLYTDAHDSRHYLIKYFSNMHKGRLLRHYYNRSVYDMVRICQERKGRPITYALCTLINSLFVCLLLEDETVFLSFLVDICLIRFFGSNASIFQYFHISGNGLRPIYNVQTLS